MKLYLKSTEANASHNPDAVNAVSQPILPAQPKRREFVVELYRTEFLETSVRVTAYTPEEAENIAEHVANFLTRQQWRVVDIETDAHQAEELKESEDV
jgi:hypothetical protein